MRDDAESFKRATCAATLRRVRFDFMVNSWITFLGGFALAMMVSVDVFSTVLVPRASHRGGRFGPLLARLVSPAWARMASLFSSARMRQAINGNLGPLILVLSLATWVIALALGFALMLYAQPQNIVVEDFGFAEALFQSTLALSTLGMINADIHGAARAIVAIAGVAGFSIVSLSVAFLLSIQNALHRREILVLMLAARAGRPPSSLRLLNSMADADETALAKLFEDWEAWTADVLQSHLSYPVLCRFRSLDENMEWLTCLGTVLDAAALVAAGEPSRHRRSVMMGKFLIHSAGRACRELGRMLDVGPEPAALDGVDLIAACAKLEHLGYAPAVEPSIACHRLSSFRSSYAPWLSAIAGRLDIAPFPAAYQDPGQA